MAYSNGMTGFTKLFGSLVFSTVWREEKHVKIVWITMLALADYNGRVMASIPGLADAARVSLDECLEALDRLKAPDPYSRTKEHEGRRIEEIDGGWKLLNYLKYRELRSAEERRLQTREAVARHRARKAVDVSAVSDVSRDKPKKKKKKKQSTEEEEEEDEERGDSIVTVVNDVASGVLAEFDFGGFASSVEGLIRSARHPESVAGVLRRHLLGMSVPVRTPAEVGQAVEDYLASGNPNFNPAFFAGYLRRVGVTNDRQNGNAAHRREEEHLRSGQAEQERAQREQREADRLLDWFKLHRPARYAELLKVAEEMIPGTGTFREMSVRGYLLNSIRREPGVDDASAE